METRFDLIVIGGGPGGYMAAIRAARLGMRTALVEESRVGGTCLNRGCIPTKAMLHAASLLREIQAGAQFGILASEPRCDYGRLVEYREETVNQLVQGVEQLLKANGVTVLAGRGTLLPGRQVAVEGTAEPYQAEHILLAAGSQPAMLPLPGMDLPGVVNSDGLFRLTELPQSLTIIGGGVIGVEFATAFSALGCQVTILEALPRLVANMDREISQNLKLILKKRGIDIHTSASVQRVEEGADGLACYFLEGEKELSAVSQKVLCAVGRRPCSEGLFAPGAEPELNRGRVVVDGAFRTSLEGVYAIGDLTGGMQLAHLASAQGVAAVERMAGQEPTVDLSLVPACLYTDPEAASVGLTEEDAKKQEIPVQVGKFPMSANGKSLISREERGFIKIVAQKDTGRILGAQMMCARATDMIGEFGTAIACGLTGEQMRQAMRPHPTYNEGVGDALEELAGGSLNAMPRRRK